MSRDIRMLMKLAHTQHIAVASEWNKRHSEITGTSQILGQCSVPEIPSWPIYRLFSSVHECVCVLSYLRVLRFKQQYFEISAVCESRQVLTVKCAVDRWSFNWQLSAFVQRNWVMPKSVKNQWHCLVLYAPQHKSTPCSLQKTKDKPDIVLDFNEFKQAKMCC